MCQTYTLPLNYNCIIITVVKELFVKQFYLITMSCPVYSNAAILRVKNTFLSPSLPTPPN